MPNHKGQIDIRAGKETLASKVRAIMLENSGKPRSVIEKQVMDTTEMKTKAMCSRYVLNLSKKMTAEQFHFGEEVPVVAVEVAVEVQAEVTEEVQQTV